MNKQQRTQWDNWINSLLTFDDNTHGEELAILANKYILKLERELQNLKGGRKVAAILKAKVVS